MILSIIKSYFTNLIDKSNNFDKYEITDIIRDKIVFTLDSYNDNIIYLEYLSDSPVNNIDDRIYLKLTYTIGLMFFEKKLYDNTIYNIKYSGSYDITDIYIDTLNNIFCSDISNIILDYLFKIERNSKTIIKYHCFLNTKYIS